MLTSRGSGAVVSSTAAVQESTADANVGIAARTRKYAVLYAQKTPLNRCSAGCRGRPDGPITVRDCDCDVENAVDTRVNLDHAAPEELSGVGGLVKVEVGFLGLAISFSFRTLRQQR
jgi:hypothetical protein